MTYSHHPLCGSRLTRATAQEQPGEPGGKNYRNSSTILMVAGIILVLIITAVLVLASADRSIPMPVAANTSALSPSPSSRPASADPENITRPVAYTPYAPAMGYSNEVPVINAISLESRIHTLVNKVRREHGLQTVGTDMALISLARAHSTDMAARGYFGHVNLDERDATARGAAAGYTCHKAADTYYTYAIAENLYATYRYTVVFLKDSRATGYAWTTEEAMAEETVDAWMNSPDHRDNLLDPGMGREGIGVAFGQGDMVFVTQDFC